MADKPKSNRDEPTPDASTSAKQNTAQNGGSAEESTEAAELSLRDQLDAARSERDANYDLYLRAQAELQNYRRRAQREADEQRLYQALPLARDLLPALDNLHRALDVAEKSKNVDELVKGVRLVARQIEDALSRHHVVAIDAAGKPFDPNVHQAIQQVPSAEHPPMSVLQEVERGFTLKDRVVRPATVIVATAPPESEPADESANPSGPTRATE